MRTRGNRHLSLCLLALLFFFNAASAQVRTEFVDPVATGPGIRPLLELPAANLRDLRHFVAVETVDTNGFLYVHLAGSGGLPENYQQVLRFAAARGYHAVSLAYPNYPSVGQLTSALGDPAAPGAVRAERLFGIDASPLVEVDAFNGVIHRLSRLLVFLRDTHPQEHWERFLDGDAPRWSRIVVGGHSQGAGHVAYLAQEFAMVGGLMFGGPGDFVQGVGLAAWLLRPLQFSPVGLYGFVHEQDPNFNLFQAAQQTLGLDQGGALQDIDLIAPELWRSNRLTSSRTDIPGGNFHGAVVVDDSLPTNADGSPGYDPVWDYMFGVALFRDGFGD